MREHGFKFVIINELNESNIICIEKLMAHIPSNKVLTIRQKLANEVLFAGFRERPLHIYVGHLSSCDL